MSKKVLKMLIFRLFALVMAFGVVYSVQNPALASNIWESVTPGAVRPQQGWYVSGTMTSSVSGVSREYFIIDNKMTSDPWYVEYLSTSLFFLDPYFEYTGFDGVKQYLYTQFYPVNYWQGYSQTDFVIDNDWLVEISIDGIQYKNATKYNFAFWDVSRMPTFTATTNADVSSSYIDMLGQVPFLVGYPTSNLSSPTYSINGTYPQSSSSGRTWYKMDYYMFGVKNPFSVINWYNNSAAMINDSPLGGVSINDLAFCVFANEPTSKSGNVTAYSMYARIALRFAIPVDKAPADTQVGDSWPKLHPLPVQIQGALDDFKAWKDNALAQTPVADAADVTSQIEGYNQQLDAADNWGELETDAWNEVVPILDSFDFVFTILGIAAVVFVLLLFIKKGMA